MLMYVCMHDLKGLVACLEVWEAFVHVGAEFLPLWENSGSAAEGTFGRRTCLWRPTFGCQTLPPKVDFRLWKGVSVAEGAAESG